MDGDENGAKAQGEQQAQQEAEPKEGQDGQAHEQEVTGAVDWEAALKAKDAQIAELEGRIADAAKSAEATEALNAEIEGLKRQMADERVEFALRSAGARNVKAARALLDEHDGDVAALKEAESWLFSQEKDASQNSSQNGGSTGLEPAGASGGAKGDYVKRWEQIAGLS